MSRHRLVVHYHHSDVFAQCGQSIKKIKRRQKLVTTTDRADVTCISCIKCCNITRQERGLT